ncbi:MAG: hypothetical protein ACYCWE_20385 [Eubacteriales bacterium]
MRNPYVNLANAVIIQAVEDYREALGILRFNPRNRNSKANKRKIERFFHSRWFRILTKTDPEMLINRLRNEVI